MHAFQGWAILIKTVWVVTLPCLDSPTTDTSQGMVAHYSCHCLNIKLHIDNPSETLPKDGFQRLHLAEEGINVVSVREADLGCPSRPLSNSPATEFESLHDTQSQLCGQWRAAHRLHRCHLPLVQADCIPRADGRPDGRRSRRPDTGYHHRMARGATTKQQRRVARGIS